MVALLRGVGWAVVDFKTQKIKRSTKGEPKPVFYETWPLQLAAYRQAIMAGGAKNVTGVVSVVVDSVQPGPVHVRQWSGVDYFGSFLAALELWKYVKDYDPRRQTSNSNIQTPEKLQTSVWN